MERSMPWFKWWGGTACDPKFRRIAEQCNTTVAVVLGMWAYLLEKASSSDSRGSIADLDTGLMAYTLMLPLEMIETVCNAMKRDKIVTSENEIAKWCDRQVKRENQEPAGASTKRVQALRAKRKANDGGKSDENSDGNDGNAGETDVTTRNDKQRPKKKSREEVDKNSKTLPPSSPVGDGAAFDQFWTAYPHKVGKVDARKAWAKLKADPELLAAILAAIEAQKQGAAWRQDDGQYIPHPASWLNGGRWLDEVRPYVERKVVELWWVSKESMVAKGLTFDPPIVPLSGDSIGTFRHRIEEALERAGRPEERRQATPYVPPMPANGDSDLSNEQRASRMAELKGLMKSMQKPAAEASE